MPEAVSWSEELYQVRRVSAQEGHSRGISRTGRGYNPSAGKTFIDCHIPEESGLQIENTPPLPFVIPAYVVVRLLGNPSLFLSLHALVREKKNLYWIPVQASL